MIFGLPIIAFLGLVLGFGFLVFVHELGHFVVAKWVGIKCTQFAIGFGPSIVAWRKGIGFRPGSTEAEYEKRLADGADPASMGETEYRLNYLPLGGYVKMLGQEDLDPTATSSDPRSFNAKPIWARACVISAGVTMNLIFGLIFFVIAFMSGVEFPPAIIGGVLPDTPAATTYAVGHENNPEYQGLQIGDRVTAIDGEAIHDMVAIRVATALGKAGEPIELTVERYGQPQPLKYVMTPQPDPVEGMLAIGVVPPQSTEVAGVQKELADAGVKPGMHLVAVAGQPVKGFSDYYRLITEAQGQAVEATFADDKGKQVQVQLAAQPLLEGDADQPANLAGFVPVVRIGDTVAGSPADRVGVQAGDVLAQLGTVTWPSLDQVFEVAGNSNDQPLSLSVWRDGEMVSLGQVSPRGGKLGVMVSAYTDKLLVGQTLADTPAAQLNLPGGSRIVSIAGQPVRDWADMQRTLAKLAADGKTEAIPVNYELNVADQPAMQSTLTLTDTASQSLADTRWAPPAGIAFQMLRERVVGENPIEATKLGFEKTGQFMAQTYIALLRLFQGSVKMSHLRGPVGIVDEGTKIAEEGWEYLLFFLGLISVNLVVINFLPIPIVDGGLMVFLLVEKLKGSPVSAKVQVGATYVGLALIGFVFLATLFYDVSRIFSS